MPYGPAHPESEPAIIFSTYLKKRFIFVVYRPKTAVWPLMARFCQVWAYIHAAFAPFCFLYSQTKHRLGFFKCVIKISLIQNAIRC